MITIFISNDIRVYNRKILVHFALVHTIITSTFLNQTVLVDHVHNLEVHSEKLENHNHT